MGQALLVNVDPVSYTHLDVYKRQVSVRPRLRLWPATRAREVFRELLARKDIDGVILATPNQ